MKVNRTFRIVSTIVVGSIACHAVNKAAPPTSASEVESVLRKLPEVAREKDGDNPWYDEILTHPRDEVIAAIRKALSNNPEYSDLQVRAAAYLVLVLHHAEQSGEGRAEFLTGIEQGDFQVRLLSLQALERVPIEHAADIAPGLDKLLRELASNHALGELTSDQRKRLLASAVRATSNLGPVGQPLLPQLKSLFNDTKVDSRIRTSAGYAILRIEGINQLLARSRDLDGAGESSLLSALGQYAVAQRASGMLDEPTARRIQDRLITGLKHPSSGVRQTALRNLDPGFGDEFLIVRSRTDYEVNPRIRPLIEEISARDADPRLREHATDLLHPDSLQKLVDRKLGADDTQK